MSSENNFYYLNYKEISYSITAVPVILTLVSLHSIIAQQKLLLGFDKRHGE